MGREIHIYTDGSCRKNGTKNAVGAWSYIFVEDDLEFLHAAKQVKDTTNQRMELTAVVEALQHFYVYYQIQKINKVIVHSDSAYLINCINFGWWRNWLLNGWKNSKKEPVANQDLWEKLIPFFTNPNICWEKVKGHDTNKWNNKADELAQSASLQGEVQCIL